MWRSIWVATHGLTSSKQISRKTAEQKAAQRKLCRFFAPFGRLCIKAARSGNPGRAYRSLF